MYYVNVGPDGNNNDFRRHVYTPLKKDSLNCRLIHYLGDHTTVIQFPHGNRKKDNKCHFRTCPSVLKEIVEVNDNPSNIYKRTVSNPDPQCSSSLQSVLLPRNVKQVRNAQAQERQKVRLTHDALYNLHEIAYDLDGFVSKIETFPNLAIICGLGSLAEQLDHLIQLQPDISLCMSYDTTFQLGDFYLSPFLFRHVLFSSSPVIPVAFLLHERKFQGVHEDFLKSIKEKLPSLQNLKKPVPIVTDDERALCNAIDNCLPGVVRLRCWNHTINSVKLWLRRHGATSSEVPIYISNIREMFHQPTEEEYLTKLQELQVDWSKPFLEYYQQEIHPEVCYCFITYSI